VRSGLATRHLRDSFKTPGDERLTTLAVFVSDLIFERRASKSTAIYSGSVAISAQIGEGYPYAVDSSFRGSSSYGSTCLYMQSGVNWIIPVDDDRGLCKYVRLSQ
jgi:hypothetical protein